MRLLYITLMGMLSAGYISAQESASYDEQGTSDQTLNMHDNGNASYYRNGHHRHHGRHHGGRGWGGYGYYDGWGYGPGYYEGVVEELPPIYEDVLVPVVERVPVVQKVIKVYRKQVQKVKVPVRVEQRVVGAPVEAPPAGGPPPGPGAGGPPPGGGEQGGGAPGAGGDQGGGGPTPQMGGEEQPTAGGQPPMR